MDPDHRPTHEHAELDAGELSPWLDGFADTMAGRRPADVPCAGCTACCSAAQFVHVGVDETDALAHLPGDLLVPAPGRPGQLVMGYDEQGRCPMLVDEGCSIYEHRPRACRTYDCRVFAAAGVVPDGPGQAAVAVRASRWRFGPMTDVDRRRLDAIRAAASFLNEHPDVFGAGSVPGATGIALAALAVHELFDPDAAPPAVDEVAARLRAGA